MGKQDDFFRTQIRIPAKTHQALKDAAEESGRSMNAEIVHHLEKNLLFEKVMKGRNERVAAREAEPVTPLSDLSEEMRMVSRQIAAISKEIERLNKESADKEAKENP